MSTFLIKESPYKRVVTGLIFIGVKVTQCLMECWDKEKKTVAQLQHQGHATPTETGIDGVYLLIVY